MEHLLLVDTIVKKTNDLFTRVGIKNNGNSPNKNNLHILRDIVQQHTYFSQCTYRNNNNSHFIHCLEFSRDNFIYL